MGIHKDYREAHLDVLHGRFFVDGKKYLLQHMSLSEILRFAGLFNDVKGFFRFGFVRNPWDRLVSDYFWRKRNRDIGSFEDFVTFACNCVFDRIDLEGDNCHYRPQFEMFDGEMDFIGRFERFGEDLDHVKARIGLQIETFPHEYKTDHVHYAAYYTDATKRMVYDAYGGDIAKFGYRFED